MFLKLTENDTMTDVYLNPDFIIRFLHNPAGDGTLLFLTADAGVAPPGETQMLVVHENSEEVFRMISRQEKPTKVSMGRGLI